MARDCPECNSPCDGSTCRSCGWTEHGTTTRPADPTRFLCHHEDRGQRCANLGTLSPSTLGGGPWYCWQHARHVHGGNAYGSQPPGSVRRTLGFKRLDAEEIAERLAIQQEQRA